MQNIEGGKFLKLGSEVEVTSNTKGWRNSWFKATIIHSPNSNSSSKQPRNNSVWVEYATIFDDDNPSKKLQELTETSLIRPLPPTPTKNTNKFEKFDFVDAYHKDGWFTGVILHVFNNGLKYLVAFLNPYEEFLYERDQIRVHFQWLASGKWTKVYSSQKVNVAFCPPKVCEIVVASLLESIPAVVSPEEQASSPAKKLKRTPSGYPEEKPTLDPNYVVQSLDEPQKFLQPCSLPSSKGDTNCNGKKKASDGENYSSPFYPKNEDIKKNDDSHSRSLAKGNQFTEVIDLTNGPEEVIDESDLVKIVYAPRKGIDGSSAVDKSGSTPSSSVVRSSSATNGSFNPSTNKGTTWETPGTKISFGAPDAPERCSGSSLFDRIKKHSLLEVASSPPVLASQSESAVATSAVVIPEEQPPSSANKLKQTTSGDAEERPSSDQNNDVQSIDAPKEFLQPCPLTSNKGNTHCNGKRKASDGKNYSSLSFSPNNNVTFCPPNGSETVVASLLESMPAVVSPAEQAPSPAKKLKLTSSTLLSVLATDQEDNKKNDAHSRSPAKGSLVTHVVGAINEPEKIIDEQGNCRSKAHVSYSEPVATECPQACPVTSCLSPRSDESQNWPFTKKSEMWKLIESMEVFKKIPRMPHFSPLNEHEENSRELTAISMMMRFSYEVERITRRSPDILPSTRSVHDSLDNLKELESHGFSTTPLQDYLTKLLFKMEKEKELNGDLEEIESAIIKCQGERASMENKLRELAQQLKSVQEQIQSEKSVKYLKDRHLAILESQKGLVSTKLDNIRLTNWCPFEW